MNEGGAPGKAARLRGGRRRERLSKAVGEAFLVLLLVALPFVYFWPLFAPRAADRMTIVEGDFTSQFFPLALLVARIVAEGGDPLWNPLSLGGQPLLADPQAAVYYPPQWLLLPHLTGHDGRSFLAMEVFAVAHLSIASLGMYLLARLLTGTLAGGLVAALTFTYAGALVSFPVQQVPVLRTMVWLPFQFLGVAFAVGFPGPRKRAAVPARDRGAMHRWLGVVLGGWAIALGAFAGHPQTWLYQLSALAGFVGWRALVVARAGGRWGGALGRGLLTLGLGLAAAAAQLVPTAEFVALSTRAETTYEFASTGFTVRELLLDLLAPGLLGGLPAYVGVLPVLLALAAMGLARQRDLPFFVFFVVELVPAAQR